MSNESVTHWIQELQQGDDAAAQEELWERYFRRLVGLARAKLGDVPRRTEDEEDVALSALNSFFVGVRKGRFPMLKDRTNLWPLLAKITARKAINQREKVLAKKRGGGKVRGESFFAKPGNEESLPGIEAALGIEPTPQFAAEMAEQCHELLDQLPEDLRLIATKKLQGYSNAEIAKEIGRVSRTVDRKLERIRSIWTAEWGVSHSAFLGSASYLP
jgi:DNA-directed RNA polymerase specialized sigma24 family protein